MGVRAACRAGPLSRTSPNSSTVSPGRTPAGRHETATLWPSGRVRTGRAARRARPRASPRTTRHTSEPPENPKSSEIWNANRRAVPSSGASAPSTSVIWGGPSPSVPMEYRAGAALPTPAAVWRRTA